MANHSATKKAIRKTVRKTAINKNKKSRIKTFIKKVVTAVAAGLPEEANKALIEAQVEIMKGVSAKLIKKNTASRKVSRLAKSVKNISIAVANNSADTKPTEAVKTENSRAVKTSTKKSNTVTGKAAPKKEAAIKKKTSAAKKEEK